MTKKSSMRTKVERTCKKPVPQKVSLGLPSPKVVLNANDCARFLDSMGKTSGLLVEKEGKMLTATASGSAPVQSSSTSPSMIISTSPSLVLSSTSAPLVVSSQNDTSTFETATQKRIYENWTSIKDIERPATAPLSTSSVDGSRLNYPNTAMNSRTFLKPPKKRRGMDKKFEEIIPTPNNNSGEVVNCVTSRTGHITHPPSAQESPDVPQLSLPLNGELPKHSVEHLLQHPLDLPVNINNNQKSVSGPFDSRPFVSISDNLPPSSSEDASSVSLSPSAPINLDSYQGRTAYTSRLYSHRSYNTALPSSYNHTYRNHPGSVSCSTSLPLSHPVSVVKAREIDNFQQKTGEVSVRQKTRKIDSFLRLPEQIEPMNLSTSCKPVVGSLQASSNADIQAADDVSTALLPHSLSHALGVSDNSEVSAVSESKLISAGTAAVSESKLISAGTAAISESKLISAGTAAISESKLIFAGTAAVSESKLVSVGTAEAAAHPKGELPKTATDPSGGCSDLHNTSVHNMSDCVQTRENRGSESVATLGSSVGSELSCEAVSSISVGVPYLEASNVTVPVSVQNQVAELPSRHRLEINTSSPLRQNTQNSPQLIQSSQSLAAKIVESSNLSQDVQTSCVDTLRNDGQEGSTANESGTVKKNKKTSKKREIPMDEVSCSERIHRYSLTINDVIANFVYVPEPLEEFSLTREEEAAIRSQFDYVPNISNKDGTDGKMIYNQCADDKLIYNHCADIVCSVSDESFVCSNSLNTIRLPKMGSALTVNAESHPQLQETVEHIDSVLAFVALDYSSPVVPDEVSSSVDLKTPKKLKKKPSGDVDQKDSKRKKPKNDSFSNNANTVENTLNCSADRDVGGVVSGVDQMEDSGEVVSKIKKVKKRKSENTGTDVNAAKLSDMCGDVVGNNLEGSVKGAAGKEKVRSRKKKRTDVLPAGCVTDQHLLTTNKDAEEGVMTSLEKLNIDKHSTLKKSNTDQRQKVSLPLDSAVDKEGGCQNRAETSDIGESIASTSGGSEQNTPVHEPESKDEVICSDPHMTDKENHDTGLESGGDDTVRRYKKRLDFVKCDQCSHQARGRSALSRHMKKVHMLDVTMPFRCERCNYGSTKMASLNRHLFTHGVFPCSRCGFVATERVKLTEHTAEQHKDKLDVRMCKKCNRYIKCDQITIEQHTLECQGPRPYQCTECEKEFKYASSLRVHHHTHFPDQPKRFKCEQCDYRTNYKANLHKHNKNMHASRDHDVQCPDCGKLFSTEDNMKRHRKVHTMTRPFSCGTCEKKFKTSGALKGHQLIHTATRPYPCSIPGCSRTFRTPKFLKSHQEEFHHLIPKKFFCSVEGCNYSFFKRSHLKRHTITHTGERNFHCSWPGCSKSFRHSDNLKVHFRSHTNEKPFQCHLCDFKCKQKNSLFWHKKRVHQIIDFSVSQRHMDVKLRSSATEHDLKRVEAASDVGGAEIEQAIPSASENTAETFVSETASEVGKIVEGVASDAGSKNSLSLNAAEVKRETTELSASVENVVKTAVVIQEEPGSLDLYEFKSDDDSADETPGSFRRDKVAMNGLTPLPPPPKELLRKNEILEMKEREKKEKADKREQERKEKVGKKEQEKNEKVEKKNQEKKVKAEHKEIEKQEKLKKLEQEKKEKIEKKELEKKEKEEKKELEKKEKLEKKELEKKEKIEKMELKKKEKLEKKQLELKEKTEKREQERKEKAEQRGKEQTEKKLSSKVCSVKGENDVECSENDDEKKVDNRSKSCSSYLTRRKSPVSTVRNESVADIRKINPGRRKLLKDSVVKSVQEKSTRVKAEKKTQSSSFKTKILASKKEEPKKSSFALRSLPRARSAARKVRRGVLKRNLIQRCKKEEKLSPPARKPSARIRAKSKAKTTTTSKQMRRGQKPSGSELHTTRKSARKKALLRKTEVNEMESVVPDNADIDTITDGHSVNKSEEIQTSSDENQAVLNSDHSEKLAPVVRPSSPASSEEVMLQGKASPYRNFSDSENQDDHTDQASSPTQKLPEYPDVHELSAAESETSASEESDSETAISHMCQATEEFSDDEVSNDILLTPPRAPAPPPVESSEDELELEPEPTPFSVPGPSTPFSVPGPNTPFSVPGPNTPFSIPPPTNLMQQHSVHSEEAPASVLQSAPSVDVHSQGSLDMHQSLGSAEMHPRGSVEMNHSHGSVEMHPRGSVEMNHSHGSVEMHPRRSGEMNHSHGSVEMHPRGSAEMNHSHGSVEMHLPADLSEIPDSHNSMTVRSHKSAEMHSHGSVEMVRPHGSVEMLCHGSIPESVSHSDHHVRTPESVIRDVSSDSSSKFDLPRSLQEQTQTDADKEYFDQYLKNLSAANNRAAIGLEPSPNGLQHLEAMVCKSHLDSKEMSAKSPISCLPTSVITSLESLPLLTNGDLRARMDSLVLDRHHDSFYARDTPSSLSRLQDHPTPLPTSAMGHSPAFDAYSSLNSLAVANGGRENSYLRQPDNLFSTPPVTSTFIAEAMFQRQAMATPFLPPQPSERSSLSRIPDPTPLRSSSSSSFLRRPGAVPSSDMYSSPTMVQNMPRHPFANAWTSQEVRPAHWQSPYLAHQSNMATTGSFFPSKDNYLTGRDFMFDPSVRPSTERSMFSSISSSQSQDSYQLDRFDLSNYFPNAMTPYGSSSASLEYSRTAHAGTAKPFDERYRQTAAISDFRGLPATGGSSEMFPGFPSVNTGFSLYAGNAMSYHAPHMTENVNSAFLTHSASAQHAMFERDYAAAAAHRSFYPQNTPYPFVDERQYHSSSKLGHAHPVAPTPVPQERDLIGRSAAPESQMQDPYRSLLYRY